MGTYILGEPTQTHTIAWDLLLEVDETLECSFKITYTYSSLNLIAAGVRWLILELFFVSPMVLLDTLRLLEFGHFMTLVHENSLKTYCKISLSNDIFPMTQLKVIHPTLNWDPAVLNWFEWKFAFLAFKSREESENIWTTL